jgi:hypothetical protein
MQRYNIFHQVHKGLRALLYETALRIQHTDFWNVEEALDTIDQINEVTWLFDKHANTEDELIFPLVGKYDPAIVDAFEQEHIKDQVLGRQLMAAIEAYQGAAVITEKAAAGKQVQSAYSKFLVFNLEHMAKEEDVLNPVLWRHYRDEELVAVTQTIVATIPQDYMIQFTRWMMRGLNNAEITAWLKGVEKNAPQPVFQALFATAEKELPGKRFHRVLEALTEGAMLA